MEKNVCLWKKLLCFIKIFRIFLIFTQEKSFFKWLSTKNRPFFCCAQLDCGRVIHRFSPLFRCLNAESQIFKNWRKLSTAYLSTIFQKARWTTPFYPHFGWISGQKWDMHNFINLFFDLLRQGEGTFDKKVFHRLKTAEKVIHKFFCALLLSVSVRFGNARKRER